MSKTLLEAMAEVDVIDAAGRIIANPKRNAPAASTATIYALAVATERFWEVCLEAEQLVRTLRKPVLPLPSGAHEDILSKAVKDAQQQMNRVTELMAALRGETPKEENHGHRKD